MSEPTPKGISRPPLSSIPGWLVRAGTSAWLTIGLIALAVLVYLGLSQVRALVAPLVVAAVMGMLFYPIVDRLADRGIPRGTGAALVLLGLTVIILAAVAVSIAGVIDQSSLVATQIRLGWERAQSLLTDWGLDVSQLQTSVSGLTSSLGGGVTGLVTATFSSVAFLLIGLFIGAFLLYYLLKDWALITGWIASHVGLPKDLGHGLIEDATTSIRRYFYALTMTSIPVAIIIGLVMWALGLPLAFTIALVTFVTTYIPYLGAIFSGAFATLVALGSGGLTDAIIVLIAVLVTQNVVQALLLTRLSSTTLAIHPIVNLGSTIVGATLAGILGATLSAPAVAMFLAGQRRLKGYGWDPTEDQPVTRTETDPAPTSPKSPTELG